MLSDQGFLYDPDSERGHLLNPNLVSFSELAVKPCLALLGEPGIGKTWALNAQKAAVKESIARDGGDLLWLDLKPFGSEDRLWKRLFEGAEFNKWRKGSYILHVFLDSLDECLLRISNVGAMIADQLPNEPVDRLRIRIACRSVPWPAILEHAFSDLFGDGFGAYELVPLRLNDVRQASEKSGISDVEAFLRRIEDLNVSSLAIKPITLRFLINTYLRETDLPSNQIDLYEKGCRILCESDHGVLSVDQRYAIASRIAAITLFTNRATVWTASEADSNPQEDVTLSEMGGTEDMEAGAVDASPAVIREVLNTGLFSLRGPERAGWAHQTYAEFLAARYCFRHQMPTQQLQSLLFHPEKGGQRLVPQLYEVAAWVSVMDPRLLMSVAGSDPEALLGAAAASLSDEQRKLVVQSVLDQCERGKHFHLRHQLFPLYPRLKHSGLAEQLRPYLFDTSQQLNTRHVVIDLIRMCEVRDLETELADLALNHSNPIDLRISAGGTVSRIGSPAVKSRFRPFAFGRAGDDPEDELKGIGLRALWPDWISATELFSLVTPPKNRHLHGAYASLLYDLSDNIKTEDLPAALDWFATQPEGDVGPIGSLMDGIVEEALKNVEAPGILTGLVKAILSRIRLRIQLMSYGSNRVDLHGLLRDDHTLRRKLLDELLPLLDQDDVFWLDYAGIRVVPESELPWLIRRIEEHQSPVSVGLEAKLVRQIVDTRRTDHMDLLWKACQGSAALKAECGDFFYIALDSDAARMLRDHLANSQRKPEVKLLEPPQNVRIEEDLTAIEDGKIAEWVRLARDLSLKPTSVQWESLDKADLTTLPGWESASDDTRKRIIDAAVRYVNEGEPDNDKWFGTSELYFSAIGGFQGLTLLLTAEPETLKGLSDTAWRKWVPILLSFAHMDSAEIKSQELLLKSAYAHAPEEVIARLDVLINHENAQHGHLFVLRKVDLCWDERLGSALLSKVTDQQLKPAVVETLLQSCLEHKTLGSGNVARSFIKTPPPNTEPGKGVMMHAIKALLSGAEDAGWPDVWPIFRDYPEFGRFAIESISYAYGGHPNFVEKLNEAEVGDLYTWLLVQYPPSAGDHRVSGAVGPKDTVVMFRDQTLENLKRRATFSACDALRDVMSKLPQYRWLACSWRKPIFSPGPQLGNPSLQRLFWPLLVIDANGSPITNKNSSLS